MRKTLGCYISFGMAFIGLNEVYDTPVSLGIQCFSRLIDTSPLGMKEKAIYLAALQRFKWVYGRDDGATGGFLGMHGIASAV